MGEARAGHEELHLRAYAVVEGFKSLARPADPLEPEESDAENPVLRALDRTLCAHLDLEEEAVIPLLLALEPEKFEHYYRSPLSLLIP